MVGKYYAVVSGVETGIYTDWPTAERMVKGFPGAIFKSFRTKAEAEHFMAKSTAITQSKYNNFNVLPLTNKTIIYTDGSYEEGLCGFGIVIITSNGDKLIAYGRVPSSVHVNGPSNNVAELYAIYVALSLVKGDAVIYTDSDYSIGCLTSYVHDWLLNGWGGVSNRNIIEGAYSLMINRDVTLQYVQAHSGIELNEEADMLAKQGRLSIESLVVFKNGERLLI